jgi:sugar lactone lactonase YvrE
VIGQPDFTSGGRNRSQLAPSATGLLLPHGVAVDGSGNLWVADDGNNRVLMYPAPHSTGMAATKVLGQADFTSGAVNRGAGFGAPQANTMAAPWGLFARGTNLYVADADNNRVLQFNNAAAKASGANADFAYGNDGLFTTVLGGVTNQRMNGPRDAAVDSSGNVYVVDIGNQRVLRFFNENRAAVAVYGQPNFTSAVANNGGISAASLANPSSIAIDVANNLYVTELSNNRVLVYRFGSTTAFGVFGQNGSFTTNTAGSSANGLSFPIAITVDGQGNVLIFSDIRRLLFYERPFAPPTATQLSVAFRSQGPGW